MKSIDGENYTYRVLGDNKSKQKVTANVTNVHGYRRHWSWFVTG